MTCLIKQRDKNDLFLLLCELVLTAENRKYVYTIFLSPRLLPLREHRDSIFDFTSYLLLKENDFLPGILFFCSYLLRISKDLE